MSDLATTLDPLALIPGRSDQVFRAAVSCRTLAERAARIGERLRFVDVDARRTDRRLGEDEGMSTVATWAALADTLRRCAEQLEQYGVALDRSQVAATEAIHLYQEGLFAAELQEDHRTRLRLDTLSAPHLDAGAPLRAAAETLLSDARALAAGASKSAAAAIRASTAYARTALATPQFAH